MSTQLNGLGLHSEVKHLMERLRSRDALIEKRDAAKEAFEENEAKITELKIGLGEQAKMSGHSLIVMVDEYAAYVPMPRVGYSNDAVNVEFSKPKGLNNL